MNDENVIDPFNCFKPNLNGRLAIVRDILHSGIIFVRYRNAAYLICIIYAKKDAPA
jgi:hypothetical protein